MAKVTMPLLSGRVSGKVGDIVFFNRWGTQLARMRVKPSNPKTEKQEAVRTDLKGLSQCWAGTNNVKLLEKNPIAEVGGFVELSIDTALTKDEKEKWIEYAQKMGKQTAYARWLFIGQNIQRLMNAQSPIRTPSS
jgi:hypothetical protein